MGRFIFLFSFMFIAERSSTNDSTSSETNISEPEETAKINFNWWAVDVHSTKWDIFDGRRAWLDLPKHLKDSCSNQDDGEGIFAIIPFDWSTIFNKNNNIASNFSSFLFDKFYIQTELLVFCCHECDKNADEIRSKFIDYYYSNHFQKTAVYKDEVIMSSLTDDYCMLDDGTLYQHERNETIICFFMLDSQSTKGVYSGPYKFHKIDIGRPKTSSAASLLAQNELCKISNYSLNDGECYFSISTRNGYIVHCCCYEIMKTCGYITQWYEVVGFRNNLREWRDYEKYRMEQSLGAYELPSWSRRLWLFGLKTSTSLDAVNVPMWFCVSGELKVKDAGNEEINGKIRRDGRLRSAGDRAKHCITQVNLGFQKDKNGSDSLFQLELKFSRSNNELRRQPSECMIQRPRCFTNILDEKKLFMTIRCSCQSGELCNAKRLSDSWTKNISENLPITNYPCHDKRLSIITHYFKGEDTVNCNYYFDVVTGKLIFLLDDYSNTDELSRSLLEEKDAGDIMCRLIEFQPLNNMECLNYDFNFTQRVFTCNCNIKLQTMKNSCNLNEAKGKEIVKRLLRSNKFLTYCFHQNYSVGVGNATKQLANRTALCYLIVIFHFTQWGVYSTRGEVSPTFMNTSMTTFVRRYKSSITSRGSYFIFTCYSNQNKACNDRKFLTHGMHYAARKLSRSADSPTGTSCLLVRDSPGISFDIHSNCYSSLGCYAFRDLTGHRIAGCLEEINALLKVVEIFKPFLLCFDLLLANKCFAVNSEESDHHAKGILCCCVNTERNCWDELQKYKAEKIGYHPYEIWPKDTFDNKDLNWVT